MKATEKRTQIYLTAAQHAPPWRSRDGGAARSRGSSARRSIATWSTPCTTTRPRGRAIPPMRSSARSPLPDRRPGYRCPSTSITSSTRRAPTRGLRRQLRFHRRVRPPRRRARASRRGLAADRESAPASRHDALVVAETVASSGAAAGGSAPRLAGAAILESPLIEVVGLTPSSSPPPGASSSAIPIRSCRCATRRRSSSCVIAPCGARSRSTGTSSTRDSRSSRRRDDASATGPCRGGCAESRSRLKRQPMPPASKRDPAGLTAARSAGW